MATWDYTRTLTYNSSSGTFDGINGVSGTLTDNAAGDEFG